MGDEEAARPLTPEEKAAKAKRWLDELSKTSVESVKEVEAYRERYIGRPGVLDWMDNPVPSGDGETKRRKTSEIATIKPILPMPLSAYMGGITVGKDNGLSLAIASKYMKQLRRSSEADHQQSNIDDFLALGTMIALPGLDRLLRGEPNKADRELARDATIKATLRLTKDSNPGTDLGVVEEMIRTDAFGLAICEKMPFVEEGFETHFGAVPENLKMYVGFILGSAEYGPPGMANMLDASLKLGYGEEMAEFFRRISARGELTYRPLLSTDAEELRKVYEFEASKSYEEAFNKMVSLEDKNMLVGLVFNGMNGIVELGRMEKESDWDRDGEFLYIRFTDGKGRKKLAIASYADDIGKNNIRRVNIKA